MATKTKTEIALNEMIEFMQKEEYPTPETDSFIRKAKALKKKYCTPVKATTKK